MPASYLRIFLALAILPVALIASVNYLIDPYEVFQTKLFKEAGATEERYLKIEFLKKNKTFDTFLLGGSRAGTTVPADIEAISPGTHFYNFFVSSGNQTDNLVHGIWLLKNQPQLKTIYVQVDWPESIGLTQANYQYLTHPEAVGKTDPGFLGQYLFFWSYNALKFKLQNNFSKHGEYKLPLQRGYYDYPKRDQLIAEDCQKYGLDTHFFDYAVSPEPPSAEQLKLIDNALDALGRLIAEAEQKGVSVKLYVTPYNHKYLDKLNLNDYLYFLQKLARLGPYWNFGFYSEITSNDCNYYEASHYIRGIAPRIYSIMVQNKLHDSNAHYVTNDSIAIESQFIKDNFSVQRAKESVAAWR